ncbi:MAG TPA: hypothetical protein VF006_26730 [Longimicrobium sp.]
MTRTALRPALALAAALGVGAWAGECPRRAAAPAAVPCAPAEGELAAGARADGLAGEFRLTLAATRGPRAGGSATGTLRLQPFGARPAPVPAAAGVRYPLFGGTDVDLAAVGAVAPGAVDRADAARPGVLVMEWPRPNAAAGSNEIMLRLGADANQGGQPRFDGAFTALTVTSLSAGRFAGRWESGGEQASAGYFCAERVGG